MKHSFPLAGLFLTFILLGKVIVDGRATINQEERGEFDFSYYRWARKQAQASGPEDRDTAYGDFDGDGKIDTSKVINGQIHILFGGENEPRPLSSFRIISVDESETLYTDEEVKKVFEQEGEAWNFQQDDFHGPMEKIFYGTRPGRRFSAKNSFLLRTRSGLFMQFEHVMIYEVYIFERTRKKFIIDHDSRG